MLIFRLLSLAILSISLLGCTRGEYKSLNELLSKSQKRYSDNFSQEQEISAAEDLKQTSEALNSILTSFNPETASQIASLLRDLSKKSGYTTRPGISALEQQYMALANTSQKTGNQDASVKLLVSRTFNLLASELEGTAFSL